MKTKISDKLYSELSPLERMKLDFKEKSMIFRFYQFLLKPTNKKPSPNKSKGSSEMNPLRLEKNNHTKERILQNAKET